MYRFVTASLGRHTPGAWFDRSLDIHRLRRMGSFFPFKALLVQGVLKSTLAHFTGPDFGCPRGQALASLLCLAG